MAQNFQDALDKAFPADKPASSGAAPSGGNSRVSAFVRDVGPIAERIGSEIGVDPKILIGQWGLETGWGKSVIPGTNNYGNIKDFRGSGVVARDNMNGSVDKYRAFASPEEFGDHFAGLVSRKYAQAMNLGDNALAYGNALRRGGYAEDPNYAAKIANAADMVRKATGGKSQPELYAPRGQYIGQTEKVLADSKKRQEIADEGYGTAFAKGFGDATDQIPELAVGAGTALADVFGMDELRDAGLGYLQKRKDESQDEARSYSSFTDSLENGDMGRWAAYAMGYGLNQLGQAALTGVIGATVGKVGLTGLLKGTAERVTAEALAKGATQELASKAGMEAAELAAKKYGAAFAMYGNTYGQELGGIYPEAVEQAKKTGNPVDLAKVFGSAGVAAALEAAPEIGIAGKLIDGAGKGSKRMLGRAAGTIPKQIGLEGGTEYAQTGVEQWGAQKPLDTAEARKERIDSAAMGAIMGGPAGAIEAVPAPRADAAPGAPAVTPAGPAPQPTPQPNSPLSNAAAAGQSAQPAQAPADPIAQRLSAAQSFVDDKAFIQAVRGAQGYGPESVTELLSAFAKARNPNLDPLIRERALTDLEGFVQGFNNRPNFTFGQNTTEAQQPSNQVAPYQPQGGAVASPVPRDDGRTLDGEIITRPERMAGANPNRLNAPPVLGLPTDEALQAKRDADAAYDQAYQDLVKAEALGEADAELQAKQQAIRDARAAREHADERLKEIEQAIEGNRAKQTAEKRRTILDAILADPETANPAARLSAELNRQGFRDTSPTADELATIQRFEDIKAAEAEPDVIPSAPNEMDAYVSPRAPQNVTVPSQQSEAKPKQAPARKLTPLEIRNYIKAGAVLNGDVLTLPDGTTIKLRGPQIAAAREAVRNVQVESAHAEVVDEQKSPALAQGRDGYESPVTVDAGTLKTILERNRGEALAEKPEKLDAWRNGTAKTDPSKNPIELVFRDRDGKLDVTDGRHRIAVAAERGDSVTAFIDKNDVEKLRALMGAIRSEYPDVSARTDDRPEGADDAIRAVGLNPSEVSWRQGKGLVKGKWSASIGDVSSNFHESAQEAANGLLEFVDAKRTGEQARANQKEAASVLAGMIQRGESPSNAEWRAIFPQYKDGHRYLRQPDVSWFLVDYLGVPKWNIKGNIGRASGIVRSDMGAEYPIVYLDRLAGEFGPRPEIRSDIDAAAHEAATSPLNDTPQPTDGQKSGEESARLIADAKSSGKDGVIYRNVADAMNLSPASVFAAFSPEQIKSAIGNDGTFDGASSDIRLRTESDLTETPAFSEWFGRSKMTNKDGEPLLFMHGSPASFEAFDTDKLGTSSSHTSSGLGHFFTRDKVTAEKYADGGNIYTGWLKIEKPYVMMIEEAQAFDDAQDSAKRRKELQKMGYDGVVILDDDGKPWATVAFEPWQFKSTDNNGAFDEFDDRMRFRNEDQAMRDTSTMRYTGDVPRKDAEDFIRKFVAEYPGAPSIMLVDSFDQLPKDIQKDALAQGSGPTRAKGAMKNGATYVVLNNHHSMADLQATIFHEIKGHAGIRKLLGPKFSQELNKLFVGLGGYSGLERIMTERGLGVQFHGYFDAIHQAKERDPDTWTDALAQSILTEEVFAHIAEQKNGKKLRDRFMALIGMVRDWLRRYGFASLADLGESDIVFLLQKAREGLREGEGVLREGTHVGEKEIVDADGRPVARESSPDYEAIKTISGRLGLREREAPTVFKDEAEAGMGGKSEPEDAPAVLRTEFSAPEFSQKARDAVANLTDGLRGETARSLNWWDRTVGTQNGKAKKDADFGRVYHHAHAFLDGVSDFANRAADKARGILPHLDSWRDIGAGLNVRKQWADSKDYQAISKAIFDGTLVNGTSGKVWSDEELKEQYGLNEKQIGFYREFRAAVDFSLETLAASEMSRLARASKLEVADRDMDMDDAKDFYVKQIEERLKEARAAIDSTAGAVVARHMEERAAVEDAFDDFASEESKEIIRKEMERRHKTEIDEVMKAVNDLEALRDSFIDKADKIHELQEQGYAPLMRFGEYTVDVVRLDKDGKPVMDEDGNPDRPFFGMFESEAEARKAEKALAEEYPGYTVTRGVLSVEASQLYRGLTPETAELFARMLGTDTDDAFQAYLKQAVANRSAMKRLIHRMGMEGFSNDVPRVLASFITSNARLSSGNWHFGDMSKAVEAIHKHKGDIKDEAIRLMQYVQNPQEEAAGLRGFLFFNFLGGSIASALVNLTQTFTTTLPYLNQFGPASVAKALPKAMTLAGKMMTKRGLDSVEDKGLREALQRAQDEGVVDPQEIHLLMAESQGNGASSSVSSLLGMVNKEWATPAARVTRAATQAWGSLFGAAEKYNRHVAFIAAWEVAPEGVDRYEFAKNAVTETQFDYTKASRPNWGRGAIGATLFTFKTFTISYLEFLSRLPSRERALAIAVLFLFAGMSGMPGADDLDDVIDTIGQKMGYNWNNAGSRHAWIVKTLGHDGANFVEHGISSMLPLDMSSRLSVANIAPGTAAFKKSNQSPAKDVQEFFGPAGSMVAAGRDVFDAAGSGKGAVDVALPILPKMFRDLRQAVDMWETGSYNDMKGRKVVDVSKVDALIKGVGFQPNTVAEPRRVERMLAQSSGMQRAIRDDIHELMARGRVEGDAEKQEAARELMRSWNEKNPDAPIRLNPASLAQRTRAMRLTSADRLVKATPKEMRGAIAAELETQR